MKEAYLWKKEGGKVRCALCSHRCLIPDGKRGICTVRENQKGRLYSLVYGKLAAVHVDPIEKKPLYHYYPGHASFSIASVGCNFRCLFCQNADISQMPRDSGRILGRDYTPQQVVDEAGINNCLSIAYTYTEPTVWFEFTKDCGELAAKRNIKNVYVSNGFMTKECIDELKKWLGAANIDLKAFNDDFYKKVCGARLEPVLESLKYLKKVGVWVEVTTLVVPEKNDSDEELKQAAEFIAGELGKETPWHISAFHPDYKMLDSYPTPVETLVRAYKIGKDAGLDYVYVGNVSMEEGRDTKCPKCGEVLIRRRWFEVLENKVKNGKCPKCGCGIAGVS
jgi:pyruvate formate lyase activating enzyme